MKKLVLSFLILLSAGEAGNTKEGCIVMLQGGVFNWYLEQTCGFNSQVSNKAVMIYNRQGCAKYINKAERKRLGDIAIDDGVQRYNRFGKREFCDVNKPGYYGALDMLNGMLGER